MGPYHPKQAAYLEPHRIPQAAHLAVAPFVQHDPGMAMAARCGIAVGVLPGDAIEARRPIVELHTREQLADHSRLRPAAHPYQIFALDGAGGVHETVRQTIGSSD